VKDLWSGSSATESGAVWREVDESSFKDQKDCENAQCKWDGTKKQCD